MLYKVETDKNEKILINKMYAGEYLSNNLGHEIINLLRSDNGCNYIYVNPLGTMGKEHNDKIDTILLVRNTGIPDTLEVLAQASDLEQVARIDKSSHKKEIAQISNNQMQYIKDNNITYGGKLLNEIYYSNLSGAKKLYNQVYITFKANELRRPKKPIFISFCKDNEYLPYVDKESCLFVCLNKGGNENTEAETIHSVDMAKASLKMYITHGTVAKQPNSSYPNRKFQNQEYAFNQLKAILKDKSLWETENTTKTADTIQENELNKYNFIDLVDKQYAEVTYSNLFQHIYQSCPELFVKFAAEILGVKISKNITVAREEGHIDLLITDENNVIVIENKIKSGINGEKYDIHGNIITNQLRDYYNYVCDKFAEKEQFFFIFAPDYNHIDEQRLQKRVSPDKVEYKVIKYSSIFKFFNNNKQDYADKIPYYREFLYALEKHTDTVDNSLEKEMQNNFIMRIKSQDD